MGLNSRILAISTHAAGGCMYYSNRILENLNLPKEVVLPHKMEEHIPQYKSWTIKYAGYNIITRSTSFLYSIIRILVGIFVRRYSCLLLFGVSNWDYYYLKLWRMTGLPSYVVIHDGKMHTGESHKKTQKQIVSMMQCATHLIFLSEYVKNLVKDNFGISKSSCIVPHGLIDYGKLPAVHKQSEKITFLFLGRVSKYKGVDILLDAIAKVPENLYDKLIIAGKWNYRNTTEYNHDKVKIIDKWLSDNEILHYIAESDVMVFPYTEASQSGVATLAINYLKPSIVTEVGALSEQFNDKAAFFIRPDSEDLAKAIIYLSEHLTNLNTMKEELKKLKAIYSWENIASKLSDFLTDFN